MDHTTLEKAKTEVMVPESKEEEDVVNTQSQKEIEAVIMEEMETHQDTAETQHHPTHIMKHHMGVTVRIVGVGIAKVAGLGIEGDQDHLVGIGIVMVAGLEIEGDQDHLVAAVTMRGDLKGVEGALEAGEEVETEGQKIGQRQL